MFDILTKITLVISFLVLTSCAKMSPLPLSSDSIDKSVDEDFKKISKINAFQQLVPDSWLSPKKENAQIFLNWFKKLNCYQLTYSNNEKMIETVTKIFNNDL